MDDDDDDDDEIIAADTRSRVKFLKSAKYPLGRENVLPALHRFWFSNPQ